MAAPPVPPGEFVDLGFPVRKESMPLVCRNRRCRKPADARESPTLAEGCRRSIMGS